MNIDHEQINVIARALIPERKVAWLFGTEKKIILTNNRYWDLLSFYKGNWHYIVTLKTRQ